MRTTILLFTLLLCVAGCRDAQHADNDNLSTTDPESTLPTTMSGSNTPPAPSTAPQPSPSTPQPPATGSAATDTGSEPAATAGQPVPTGNTTTKQ